jgi:hypothetical protein
MPNRNPALLVRLFSENRGEVGVLPLGFRIQVGVELLQVRAKMNKDKDRDAFS